MLNVGGRRFMTTAATLLAVEGSFLWKLISVQQAAGTPKPGAEFFIDRNGSVSACTREMHGSCPDRPAGECLVMWLPQWRVGLTACGSVAPSGVLLGPGTAPGRGAGCGWLLTGSEVLHLHFQGQATASETYCC